MNNTRLLVVIALCVAFTGVAVASEVYKWTDEEGNVHYEDRPSATAEPELMALSYRRTDPAAVQVRKQGLADNLAARQETKALQAEEQQAAAAKAAEEADRQSKCAAYRAKLETFVNSRRLYRQDENGERAFLEEDEIQKTRERAEELVAKYCTS